jgi:hypothetical protein
MLLRLTVAILTLNSYLHTVLSGISSEIAGELSDVCLAGKNLVNSTRSPTSITPQGLSGNF